MHKNTKVATCCYCGTRAALILDKGHHELICSGCGAPLHDLKMLPVRREARAEAPRGYSPPKRDYRERPRKKKKRKIRAKKIFEEAFDLIEDIFD